MEILFVTHKHPPSIGGMENQSFQLVEGIAKRAKIHRIAYTGDTSKVGFYTSLLKNIKKMLKAHPNISIIHCNDGLTALLAAGIKSFTDVPLTATLHGLDVVFPHPYFQTTGIDKIRQYDMLFPVSEATGQACIERGFSPQQITVIPNGVDHDIASIPHDDNFGNYLLSEFGIDAKGKRIIATVGRTVARKGFSWFIENVLPQLDDNVIFLMMGPFNRTRTTGERIVNVLPSGLGNNINLLFGNPTDQPKIRTLLADDRFKNRVYHLGKMPFKKMMQCLSFSDMFIMPNLDVAGDFEGFGLVSLEAAMRSTPVLAARLEGITEAIHHEKNGYLIPSADASAWVKQIKSVLDHPEQARQKAIEAKDYTLSTFSWDKMVDKYFKAFQALENKSANLS